MWDQNRLRHRQGDRCAATLVWNGPLGAFETAAVRQGDDGVRPPCRRPDQRRQAGPVAGGGDTVAALNRAGAAE